MQIAQMAHITGIADGHIRPDHHDTICFDLGRTGVLTHSKTLLLRILQKTFLNVIPIQINIDILIISQQVQYSSHFHTHHARSFF